MSLSIDFWDFNIGWSEVRWEKVIGENLIRGEGGGFWVGFIFFLFFQRVVFWVGWGGKGSDFFPIWEGIGGVFKESGRGRFLLLFQGGFFLGDMGMGQGLSKYAKLSTK